MTPPNKESEPVIVLVLYALAALSVIVGMILGISTGGTAGAYYGLTIGLGGSLGWWAMATIIAQLHQIVVNTSNLGRPTSAPPAPAPSVPPKGVPKSTAVDTYKL